MKHQYDFPIANKSSHDVTNVSFMYNTAIANNKMLQNAEEVVKPQSEFLGTEEDANDSEQHILQFKLNYNCSFRARAIRK